MESMLNCPFSLFPHYFKTSDGFAYLLSKEKRQEALNSSSYIFQAHMTKGTGISPFLMSV